MSIMGRLLPRSQPYSAPKHGSDCAIQFVRCDDNRGALIDVWEVTMSGRTFHLRLMRMLHRPDNDPFVFGSILDMATGLDIWQFRTDERHLSGFRGDVQTAVSTDGLTTEVVYTTYGKEKHRVLFADLLGLGPKPQRGDALVLTSVAPPRVTAEDARPMQKTVIVPAEWDWRDVVRNMCVSTFTKMA